MLDAPKIPNNDTFIARIHLQDRDARTQDLARSERSSGLQCGVVLQKIIPPLSRRAKRAPLCSEYYFGIFLAEEGRRASMCCPRQAPESVVFGCRRWRRQAGSFGTSTKSKTDQTVCFKVICVIRTFSRSVRKVCRAVLIVCFRTQYVVLQVRINVYDFSYIRIHRFFLSTR